MEMCKKVFVLLVSLLGLSVAESASATGSIFYYGLAWKNPANLNRIKHQRFFSGTYIGNPQMETQGTYSLLGTLNGTINSSQTQLIQDLALATRATKGLVVQAYYTHPHTALWRPPITGFQRRNLTSFFLRSYEIGGEASYQLLHNLAIGAKVGYTRLSHVQLGFNWGAGPNIGTNLTYVGEDHEYRYMIGLNYMPIRGTLLDFSFAKHQIFNLTGGTRAPGGARASGTVRFKTPSVYQFSLTQFLTKRWFLKGALRKEKWSTFAYVGPVPLPSSITGGTTKTWVNFNSKDSWVWDISSYYQIRKNIGIYGLAGYATTFLADQAQILGAPFPNLLYGGIGTQLTLLKGLDLNFYVTAAQGDVKLSKFNTFGYKGKSHVLVYLGGLELTYKFNKS